MRLTSETWQTAQLSKGDSVFLSRDFALYLGSRSRVGQQQDGERRAAASASPPAAEEDGPCAAESIPAPIPHPRSCTLLGLTPVLRLPLFPLSLCHPHGLLLNKFQRLVGDNGAEKPGSAFAFTPRGIRALSPGTTEGTELTWLKCTCPKQKLFIFLLSPKKFR